MCRLFPVSDVRYVLSPVKTPADEWGRVGERTVRRSTRNAALPAGDRSREYES
jgi:hypothetical protein